MAESADRKARIERIRRIERIKMLEERSAADEAAPESDALSDFGVKASEGLLFGARPFVAGLGGGLGEAALRLGKDDGESLGEKIKGLPTAFKKGFSEERENAQIDEERISRERPGMSAATTIGTALATVPLMAAKGLQVANAGKNAGLLTRLFQGSKLATAQGAALGAANALGHADDATDAATMIGTGTVLGFGSNLGMNSGIEAAKATGKAALKGASALSGVSENEISTYINRNDAVKKLLKDTGGDIPEAADQFREGLGRDLQAKRQSLNSQISSALDDQKYANTKIDGKPVLDKLFSKISEVNPKTAQFKTDDLNELNNVLDMARASMDDSGMIDLKTLNSLKQELQDIATPSYNNGTKIFSKGDLAAKAAKNAAGEARRLVNKTAPEIKEANTQLSLLHSIEDKINKGLLAPGKPEGGLLAAGRGDNQRNRKMLEAIDSIAGTKAVEGAENLASAKTFGKPPLLPMDATGKSLTRMATGAAVGYLAGGEQGGIAGAALTSPFALRTALDSGLLAKSLVNKIGAPAAMQRLLADDRGRAMLQNLVQSASQAQQQEKKREGLLSQP